VARGAQRLVSQGRQSVLKAAVQPKWRGLRVQQVSTCESQGADAKAVTVGDVADDGGIDGGAELSGGAARGIWVEACKVTGQRPLRGEGGLGLQYCGAGALVGGEGMDGVNVVKRF
jgi:hypothetical protein